MRACFRLFDYYFLIEKKNGTTVLQGLPRARQTTTQQSQTKDQRAAGASQRVLPLELQEVCEQSGHIEPAGER